MCVLCLCNTWNCGFDPSREFRKVVRVEGGKRARRVSTTRLLVKIISTGEPRLPIRDWSPSLTGLTKGVFISRTLWLFSLPFFCSLRLPHFAVVYIYAHDKYYNNTNYCYYYYIFIFIILSSIVNVTRGLFGLLGNRMDLNDCRS